MTFTKEMLVEAFVEFRNRVLIPTYRFGDESYYVSISDKVLDNNGCNPFIETEDDCRGKFGAFLERHFLGEGFTVHFEMNRIYARQTERADITIHFTDGTP